MARGRFSGIFSRSDAGDLIDAHPALQRAQAELAAQMPQSRNRFDRQDPDASARDMMERLLVYAFDTYAGDAARHLRDHIESIDRIRGEIHAIYDALNGLRPGQPLPPDIDPNQLGRLFAQLEGHLRAIGEANPANYMRRNPHREELIDDGLAEMVDQRSTEQGDYDPTDPLYHDPVGPIRRAGDEDPPLSPQERRQQQATQRRQDQIDEAGAPPQQPQAPQEVVNRHFVGSREPIPYQQGREIDIRDRFQFLEMQQGDTLIKQVSGELGDPRRVIRHRDEGAQSDLSSQMGDDAGHLIGNQFGAPGDLRNLSLQNWVQNRFHQGGDDGTWYRLEMEWRGHLEAGSRVFVTVRDHTRAGEYRPYMRVAEFTIVDRNGNITTDRRIFANTESTRSRGSQYVPPTPGTGQGADVIPVDFQTGRRTDLDDDN
jgi:hypothetical protein